MFSATGIEESWEAIDGLVASDAWRAEKIGAALSAIAYEETIFAVDELLGWYADLVEANIDVERALTRLMTLIMTGDLALVADAVRRAVRARREVQHAIALASGPE